MAEIESHSIYEWAGGMPAFVALVDDFYDRVAADPFLRPMFPADLGPPKERLSLFLAQYFGGPGTYSEQRGHPRLRMRHFPFRIGKRERDAWLGHMLAALDASDIGEPARSVMRKYFEDGSAFMINAEL